MFNYITELDKVDIDENITIQFEVEGNNLYIIIIIYYLFFKKGHDLESLLFAFLDELLFRFSTEFIICKEISIIELDIKNFKLKVQGYFFVLFLNIIF